MQKALHSNVVSIGKFEQHVVTKAILWKNQCAQYFSSGLMGYHSWFMKTVFITQKRKMVPKMEAVFSNEYLQKRLLETMQTDPKALNMSKKSSNMDDKHT